MNASCALNWIQYFASAASQATIIITTTSATTTNCKQQSFLCLVDSCIFFLLFFMAIAHFMAFFFRDFWLKLIFFLLPTLFSSSAECVCLVVCGRAARGVKGGGEWACLPIELFSVICRLCSVAGQANTGQKREYNCLPGNGKKR